MSSSTAAVIVSAVVTAAVVVVAVDIISFLKWGIASFFLLSIDQ
jgi:hypothetical protein